MALVIEEVSPGMDTQDQDVPDAATAASKSFKMVGNQIRAQILQALGDARGPQDAPPVLSFSKLRDVVPSEIDSGLFNYHLQQLVGHYVHHSDEGYQMRPAGMLLYRTIQAGTITGELTIEAFSIGVDCYRCGGHIEANSSFGEFWIQCTDCDTFYDMVMAPPRGIETTDTDELLTRLDQYNRHKHVAYLRGICPICMSPVEQDLKQVDAEPYNRAHTRQVHIHWSCHHCGNRRFASLGMALLETPAVISLLEKARIDPTERTVWEFEWAMTDHTLEVVSEDPSVFSIDIEADGNFTTLRISDDLQVLS